MFLRIFYFPPFVPYDILKHSSIVIKIIMGVAMTEQKTDMEMQIQNLLQNLQSAQEKLAQTEQLRDEYKGKYFQFKGIFQRQTKTFYQYQSLSKSSREALSGIFKGTSFEEFLACGVQPGNIDALWEFARTEALKENMADVAILEEIITYFVHLYNGTNDSPILGIQEVSVGDTFDMDLHIRTQKSKPAGTVRKVLLTGLTNAFTGEIIKKAIVEID